MRHTPTPWVDDNTRKDHTVRVLRYRGVVVARIPPPVTKSEQAEVDGNVALMQAAPEMFDLLRAVYENTGADGWSGSEDAQRRFEGLMARLGVLPPMGVSR